MANTNTKKSSKKIQKIAKGIKIQKTTKTVKISKKVDVRIQMMKNGKWGVIKNGNKNPSKITTTQRDAIIYGRTIAKKTNCEMVIYNKAGNERRRYYR